MTNNDFLFGVFIGFVFGVLTFAFIVAVKIL